MEQTFLFEKALAETGIDQNQLPANIQTDLSELTTLCRALYDTPDENMAELEKLNDKIDSLDEKIASNINDIAKAPATATATPPTDQQPPVESSQNTGAILIGLTVVGGIIWGAMKFFSGKQQK
jgi:hypothetical protein